MTTQTPRTPLYQPQPNNNLSHLHHFSRDTKTTKTRVFELNSPRFPLLLCAPLYTLDARIKTNCSACFKQNHPIFDRTKSATFKRLHQNHTLAGYFNFTVLECYYFVSGSGLSSSGLISTETFHTPSLPGKHGSPFSVLEERAYRALVSAISGYFEQFKNVKKVVTRKYPKNLCYNYPRCFGKFPSVVWHFEGADLEVNGASLFPFESNFLMSNFICFLGVLSAAECEE
ncbi:eukaryotic aspartyl protease family protein [Striga asiatica]|uniref:Eukaryotic aspartyl protease family protein n=1 Tax=Striga asiatica TaxID=4170 RepID=A0A5A7PM31_STRAF|nr:eukaryotic aspartyl protease family protein [Striga asiatica]